MYYKDETHYFVMTAKKQSLLEKGVLKRVNFKSKFNIPHVLSVSVGALAWSARILLSKSFTV